MMEFFRKLFRAYGTGVPYPAAPESQYPDPRDFVTREPAKTEVTLEYLESRAEEEK